MKRIFLCTTLFGVLALACSALVGDNRYGAPHSGNSLNHRNVGNYNSGHLARGPSAYGAPRAPARPSLPAYGGVRNYGSASSHYSAPSGPNHYSAPSGPNHYSAPSGPNHYSAPSGPNHYSAPAPYGGPSSYGSRSHVAAPSHYSSPKRSVYQPQQPAHSSGTRFGNNNYPQQSSSFQSHSESKSHTQGREMKYTINDPHNKGTTHVTETHVVSNRQMHGAEAEAAMKKLMGSMGPGPSYGNDGGFQDFVKGMGLPFY